LKQDLDGDGDSGADEVGSDIENVDELRGWLSSNSAKSPFLPNQILVRKFLPPGNVMELYEEYKATQQMLGGHHVSYLGHPWSMFTKKKYIYIYVYISPSKTIFLLCGWVTIGWVSILPIKESMQSIPKQMGNRRCVVTPKVFIYIYVYMIICI
jgi:hypothetical protein